MLKRKYADRPTWERILEKDFTFIHEYDEENTIYITYFHIHKVKDILEKNYGQKKCIIVDNGYLWIGLYPTNGNFATTIMLNEKKEIVQIYFDVIKSSGIDFRKIPYIDDMFLDIVKIPGEKSILLDKDDLIKAYTSGIISEDDFNLANNVGKMLVEKIDNDEENIINKYQKYIDIYYNIFDKLGNIDIIAFMNKCVIDSLLSISLLSYYNVKIMSMSIIGSVAKKCFTNNSSDLDILILVKKDFNDKQFLSDLKSYGFDFNLTDDIYACVVNSQNISICFRQYHEFVNKLESLIDGKCYDIIKKSWVIGGKIEEVILTDIKLSIILFDKESKLIKIKNKLNEDYPLKLHYCFKTLSSKILQKINMLLKYIEKNRHSIEVFTGYYEILVDLSRYICFKTKRYHYGYKHFLIQKDFYLFDNIYLNSLTPSIFEVKSNISLIAYILENDFIEVKKDEQ